MKKWTIERPDEDVVNTLATALSIPSVHAKINVAITAGTLPSPNNRIAGIK